MTEIEMLKMKLELATATLQKFYDSYIKKGYMEFPYNQKPNIYLDDILNKLKS